MCSCPCVCMGCADCCTHLYPLVSLMGVLCLPFHPCMPRCRPTDVCEGRQAPDRWRCLQRLQAGPGGQRRRCCALLAGGPWRRPQALQRQRQEARTGEGLGTMGNIQSYKPTQGAAVLQLGQACSIKMMQFAVYCTINEGGEQTSAQPNVNSGQQGLQCCELPLPALPCPNGQHYRAPKSSSWRSQRSI